MNRRFFKGISIGASLAAFVYAPASDAPNKSRVDNIPMYGQPDVIRPDRLKTADAQFIKKAVRGFQGDRKAACVAWCAVGDEFFDKNDLDHAMRRYNQGWLLDPESYLPYWGFARVALQQDKFENATKFLERAMKLCTDPRQRPALLSDAGSAYSYWAISFEKFPEKQRAEAFAKANECFELSTTLASDYGNAWKRWSMSLFREEKFADAWVKLQKARQTGATNVPESFVRALSKAVPESQ